jgi:hypothetical protein
MQLCSRCNFVWVKRSRLSLLPAAVRLCPVCETVYLQRYGEWSPSDSPLRTDIFRAVAQSGDFDWAFNCVPEEGESPTFVLSVSPSLCVGLPNGWFQRVKRWSKRFFPVLRDLCSHGKHTDATV